jgi:hypothetical protein
MLNYDLRGSWYELIDWWNSMKLRQTEPTKSIENAVNYREF